MGIPGIQEAMNIMEQQNTGGFIRDPKESLSLHTLVKPLSDMTPDEQKEKIDEVMRQYQPIEKKPDVEPEKAEEEEEEMKVESEEPEKQEEIEQDDQE